MTVVDSTALYQADVESSHDEDTVDEAEHVAAMQAYVRSLTERYRRVRSNVQADFRGSDISRPRRRDLCRSQLSSLREVANASCAATITEYDQQRLKYRRVRRLCLLVAVAIVIASCLATSMLY